MARIILVRHGETEWNRLLRYQGQTDTELNATGIAQAEKIRDRLATQQIDFVYCSDLKRAVQTAEIIAASRNPAKAICATPLLREMHFGDFEGLNFEEMKIRFPHIVNDYQGWKNRGPDVHAPNGESINQLAERIRQFALILEKRPPEETMLVVAHGGSLQVLICLLLELSTENWWKMRLTNASVSIVETYEMGASLALLNDVCHLG